MTRMVGFADPFKQCRECGGWVDGMITQTVGPDVLLPCEHTAGYRDVCPSWGPVDGCTCPPATHDMRKV